MHVIVALPGLHGGTCLFDDLVASCPERVDLRVLDLPSDLPLSYAELEGVVAERLPEEPFTLLAESFSGPLATRLAQSTHAIGLIFCASFVSAPLPAIARALPWGLLARIPPPLLGLSWMMTGGDAKLARAARASIADLPPQVLANRIRQVATVDASDDLARLSCPILCLRPSRDRLIPPRCIEDICRVRPETLVRDIDAPHMLLQAAAERCWQAILPFLSKDRAPATSEWGPVRSPRTGS